MSAGKSRSESMNSADNPAKTHGTNGLDTDSAKIRAERRAKRNTENLSLKPSVSVIDENVEMKTRKPSRQNSDLVPPGAQVVKRKDSRYASNTSLNNTSHRITMPSNGVVNQGYNGSMGGSNNSITVVREQYCSCTRWSKLEKILVIMVSVLAFMVLALVITVGILADGKSSKIGKWWD